MAITNYGIRVSLIKAIETQLDRILHKSIKPNSTFKSIGVDSMDMLGIICDMETEYDINIPDNAISRNNTIENTAETIFFLILNN